MIVIIALGILFFVGGLAVGTAAFMQATGETNYHTGYGLGILAVLYALLMAVLYG